MLECLLHKKKTFIISLAKRTTTARNSKTLLTAPSHCVLPDLLLPTFGDLRCPSSRGKESSSIDCARLFLLNGDRDECLERILALSLFLTARSWLCGSVSSSPVPPSDVMLPMVPRLSSLLRCLDLDRKNFSGRCSRKVPFTRKLTFTCIY